MRKILSMLSTLLLSCSVYADQQPVNVGASGNDRSGDPARTAFTKLNANDAELYARFPVTVANGGTGVPTITGVLKGNGTGPFTPATIADIAALATGSCSVAVPLRGDGSCGTLPGSAISGGTTNVNTTGNAATATALAAVPVACVTNQFATSIAASGNLGCAAVAATQVSNFTQAAALGNIVILQSSPTWAADFAAADLALCNAGGGNIVLQPPAVGIYTLAANVTLKLDTGCGVGLIGNNAVLYAPNHTTATLLALSSTPPASGFPISGYDTGTSNYLQKRVSVANFTLIGPGEGIGTGTSNGLDVNQVVASSNRAPRPNVQNFAVWGFHKNICLRNQGYLASFRNFISTNGDYGIYFNGGVNAAENQTFYDGTVANNSIGIVFDTAAENGTASIIDVFFNGMSLDYNAQQVKLLTGNGQIRFFGGNYEHNNAATAYPWDLTGTPTNTVQVLLTGLPRINYTGGAPSTGYTNYFNVGASTKLRVEQPFLNNILGSGATIGTLTYPAIATVAAGGKFELTGATAVSIPTMAPVASLDANNSWLADPGFEQTTIIDQWWIYQDGGTITTPASIAARYTGTKIASIATGTAKPNGGARSLVVTLNAEGALSAGNRVVALLTPRRADQFFAQIAYASDGGTGAIAGNVYPVIVDAAPGGFAPIIAWKGTSLKSFGPTPTTTYIKQAMGNSTNTNSPRLSIPAAANALLWLFDLSAINNASGHVYIDDLYVTGF